MKNFFKIIFLFSLFILWGIEEVFCQAPAIQWQNTIGGTSTDWLYTIRQTADGGYILGGYTYSTASGDVTDDSIGRGDFWIVKTDSFGNIIWNETIGGSDREKLYSIEQTADRGYIIGGSSWSNISGYKSEDSNGGEDYWIIKTDSTGAIQWQNTIGGSGDDELHSIQQTSDQGYILGGFSYSGISGDKTENCFGFDDFWIVKTDSLGNIQWQNTIGGSGGDELYSIQQTTDGGYVLGGWSQSNISGDKTENCIGANDYWIVKTDSLGNVQWQNTIGGSFGDGINSIQQTTDGGYILGGSSNSSISGDKTENSNGVIDYWIVKTDSLGNIQWQNTIGGSADDRLSSLQQTSDGGYILGGYSNSNISGDKTEDCSGAGDYWVVKTDGSGNIQWQNTIGGSIDDELNSISQTTDGGYILGGFSMSNISGDKTENSTGGYDYWIIKLAPDATTTISEGGIQNTEIKISPNPFNNQFTVQTQGKAEVKIYDVFGRIILSQEFSSTFTLQTEELSRGIYFAEVTTDKESVVKKVVKQ